MVEFYSEEVKHKFGLDKFPNIPTESLVVAARNIIKSIDTPSDSRQTDIQFMALQYWAEMCVELLGMRIKALDNQIDKQQGFLQIGILGVTGYVR
jgi:hypothetical protein